MDSLLPDFPRAEEAAKLGGQAIADQVIEELAGATPDLAEWARGQGVDAYFVKFFAEMDEVSLAEAARSLVADPTYYRNRVNNYGYASLFWLTRGRKGTRIRKYYAGSDTFLALASGNIRYLLELIDESIATYFADEKKSEGPVRIGPQYQTEAAKAVAKRRLDQLEGVSEKGVALKRLVLAIGKVFYEFARTPVGHTPEVASFVLSGPPEKQAEIAGLLADGVSHLAIEVAPRTKATSDNEMRDDDEYFLHPIFVPFFEYTHRRKRRATFSAEVLLELQTRPQWAIEQLVAGRRQAASDELPDQLAMFDLFFSGKKR